MPWADGLVTEVEMMTAECPNMHPETDAEMKLENFGWMNGRVVAFDYGIAEAREVHERRIYYKSFPAGPCRGS
jgi:hypothetical protein